MDESRIALAFVAKRQGASSLPASTWSHVLSLELGWLPPGAARRFVAACVDAGLLTGDEVLSLAFDGDVEVPRGFRLSPDAVPEQREAQADPFLSIVDELASALGTSRNDVLDGMAQEQARHGGLLDATAAVLLHAASVDVRDHARRALAVMQGDTEAPE